MTSPIDGPAVAYIVADFDDAPDTAPSAWRAARRRSAIERTADPIGLSMFARQLWQRLRGASVPAR